MTKQASTYSSAASDSDANYDIGVIEGLLVTKTQSLSVARIDDRSIGSRIDQEGDFAANYQPREHDKAGNVRPSTPDFPVDHEGITKG